MTNSSAASRSAASFQIRSRSALSAVALLAVFSALCVAGALTALPQGDEAAYADASYNLRYHGFAGITIFHLPEYMPLSFARQAAAHMPGYFYLCASWFRLFGFGLLQFRLLSLPFALLALASWYVILGYLFHSTRAGLLAMTLVAVDYFFLYAGAHGRPEAVCAGSGAAAIASYILLRRRWPAGAFLLSHAFAAFCILQHPAGMIYWLCLVFLILFCDRDLLSPKTIVMALAPCLAGLALWGAYIFQNYHAFLEQYPALLKFNEHVFDDPGLSRIGFIRKLQLELVHRYLEPFGLMAGLGLVKRLKALILVAYVSGVAGALWLGWRRRKREFLILSAWALVAAAYLTFVAPQKFSYYLPYVTPFLAACLAGTLYRGLSPQAPRFAVPLIVALLGAIQIGGFVSVAAQNAYHKDFLPAIHAIDANTRPDTMLVGCPELWFGLRDRPFVSDPTLGYENGVQPSQFVFDPLYQALHQADASGRDPGRYAYIQSLLDHSNCVFKNAEYRLCLASDEVIAAAHAAGRTAEAEER